MMQADFEIHYALPSIVPHETHESPVRPDGELE